MFILFLITICILRIISKYKIAGPFTKSIEQVQCKTNEVKTKHCLVIIQHAGKKMTDNKCSVQSPGNAEEPDDSAEQGQVGHPNQWAAFLVGF